MQYALKLVTNFDMQHACMVLTWLRKCVKALKNTKESRVLATKFFFSDSQSFKSVTKRKNYFSLIRYTFNFDE